MALLLPDERRRESEHFAAIMADMDSRLMGAAPADPNADHDHK